MAFQEGMYKVQFQTPLGSGNGVLFLYDGKLRGGDSSMYYLGSYQADGNKFTATLKTGQHGPGQSVLGAPNATLEASGEIAGGKATIRGSVPDAPQLTFSAVMERIAD